MISSFGRWAPIAVVCAMMSVIATRAPAETPAPPAEPAKAAAEPAATPAEAAPETGDTVDDDARAVLQSFGKLLKAQPRFGFAVEIGYEVLQDDGEKLEFGSSRVYTMRRPDRLRITEVRRSGGAREIYFDGNQLAVWIPGEKAYALAKLRNPRDLDSMINLMRDDLDIPMPLSEILTSDPFASIEQELTSAYLVGREILMGTEVQHVAIRTEEVDAEIWISTGDQPLLQRIVIHYRELEGQPRFWAQFSKWTTKPDSGDAVFAFTPPADAERVRMVIRGKDVQPPEEPKP